MFWRCLGDTPGANIWIQFANAGERRDINIWLTLCWRYGKTKKWNCMIEKKTDAALQRLLATTHKEWWDAVVPLIKDDKQPPKKPD